MPNSINPQSVADQILQFGQFALLVIACWVAIMLFTSFLDRHPRSQQSDRDASQETNKNDAPNH